MNKYILISILCSDIGLILVSHQVKLVAALLTQGGKGLIVDAANYT